jgi:hypothetical protein
VLAVLKLWILLLGVCCVVNKDESYASCPVLCKFVRLLVLTLSSPAEILLSYPSHTAAGEVVARERRTV